MASKYIKPVNERRLIDQNIIGPYFDKEKCIKEYMDETGVSYEKACKITTRSFKSNYRLLYKTFRSYAGHNHRIFWFLIKILFCYLVGYFSSYSTYSYYFSSYSTDSYNTLKTAIITFLILSLISYIFDKFIKKCEINSVLIDDFIVDNQLDIESCVQHYVNKHPNVSKEDAEKDIINFFETNYEIVDKEVEDHEKISRLNSKPTINSIDSKQKSGSTVFKSNVTRKNCCPYCGSYNISLIDDAPGGYHANSVGYNFTRPIDNSRWGFGVGNYYTDISKSKKKVVSKRKAMLGILTGGTSLFFTGLRSEVTSQWICNNCHKSFYKK